MFFFVLVRINIFKHASIQEIFGPVLPIFVYRAKDYKETLNLVSVISLTLNLIALILYKVSNICSSLHQRHKYGILVVPPFIFNLGERNFNFCTNRRSIQRR